MNIHSKLVSKRAMILSAFIAAPQITSASTIQTFAFTLIDEHAQNVGDVSGALRFSEIGSFETFSATIRTDGIAPGAEYSVSADAGTPNDLILDGGWNIGGNLFPDISTLAGCAPPAIGNCQVSLMTFSFGLGAITLSGTETILATGAIRPLFGSGDLTHLNAVPLPAAFPLFASALAGIGFFNRKRKIGQALPA